MVSESQFDKSIHIECMQYFDLDLVWIAFGSQFALHLFEVNVERGVMIDLEITVNINIYLCNH